MKTKICKVCSKRKTLEMFAKDINNESSKADTCYICSGEDIRLFERLHNKICRVCKNKKPLTSFSNNRYGKISICRSCYYKRTMNFKHKKCLGCEFLVNTKDGYYNKVLSCSLEKVYRECNGVKTVDDNLDNIRKSIAKL